MERKQANLACDSSILIKSIIGLLILIRVRTIIVQLFRMNSAINYFFYSIEIICKMDRKIEKRKWTAKKVVPMLASIALLGFIAHYLFQEKEYELKVDKSKMSVATVSKGNFQEYIFKNGILEPVNTRYVDALQSGYVKKIHKESGEMLKAGDVIMELANAEFELQVMERKALLYEQLNLLRNSKLQLNQNTLGLKSDLEEINYKVNLLEPKFKRVAQLYNDTLIAQEDYEAVMYEYGFNQKRKKLISESLKNDSLSRNQQFSQIQQSEKSTMQSLAAVDNILNSLIIRAPRAGQVSLADIQEGQSVSTGMRLGQINDLNDFKLRVAIDEIYLSKIKEGQRGDVTYKNKKYKLNITKIYPTIKDNLFNVDMEFVDGTPRDIKVGQSFRVRLELSSQAQAYLLPVGAFYNDTGGKWVYVMEDDKAVRRNVTIGRKNPDYYEVLAGLDEGDEIIISSYEIYGQSKMLSFK